MTLRTYLKVTNAALSRCEVAARIPNHRRGPVWATRGRSAPCEPCGWATRHGRATPIDEIAHVRFCAVDYDGRSNR